MAAQATAEQIREVNERYHDVAAGEYDSKWGIGFDAVGQDQVVTKVRKALGKRPPTFARALEIGSGTGYFTLNLMLAGIVESAVCTDISPGMLASLRANARRLGLEVETVAGDAAMSTLGRERLIDGVVVDQDSYLRSGGQARRPARQIGCRGAASAVIRSTSSRSGTTCTRRASTSGTAVSRCTRCPRSTSRSTISPERSSASRCTGSSAAPSATASRLDRARRARHRAARPGALRRLHGRARDRGSSPTRAS